MPVGFVCVCSLSLSLLLSTGRTQFLNHRQMNCGVVDCGKGLSHTLHFCCCCCYWCSGCVRTMQGRDDRFCGVVWFCGDVCVTLFTDSIIVRESFPQKRQRLPCRFVRSFWNTCENLRFFPCTGGEASFVDWGEIETVGKLIAHSLRGLDCKHWSPPKPTAISKIVEIRQFGLCFETMPKIKWFKTCSNGTWRNLIARNHTFWG